MYKVLDIHAQRLVHGLRRTRSRTQPAPNAVLDDGARAIAGDGVAAGLQRQQERGLPCAGATCDDYSRHLGLPSWMLATPNGLGFSRRERAAEHLQTTNDLVRSGRPPGHVR